MKFKIGLLGAILTALFTITGVHAEASMIVVRTSDSPQTVTVTQKPETVTVSQKPETIVTPQKNTKGEFTGVIIDCRGLGLRPVMSPTIQDVNGEKIYGHKNLDYDLVAKLGMASYVHDIAQAGRAGTNPLVLKAETVDENSNPVLSAKDGKILVSENAATEFLSKLAVVFIY